MREISFTYHESRVMDHILGKSVVEWGCNLFYPLDFQTWRCMMKKLGSLQYAIIILTVVTAVIHLVLGVAFGEVNPLFILNGIGYLVLVVALYFVPQLAAQRSLVRWALILFTAVTFILYFVFNWPDIWGPIGLLDKAIELVLIILLWLDRNN